jgi:hypothetical protein
MTGLMQFMSGLDYSICTEAQFNGTEIHRSKVWNSPSLPNIRFRHCYCTGRSEHRPWAAVERGEMLRPKVLPYCQGSREAIFSNPQSPTSRQRMLKLSMIRFFADITRWWSGPSANVSSSTGRAQLKPRSNTRRCSKDARHSSELELYSD